MNSMKSRLMAIPLLGALVCATGCVSAMVESQMAKQGYKKATREQMLLPATPSFPSPETKSAIAALPREKLVGQWSCSYVMDSRTSLLSMGYIGPSQTMSSHQTYWFFEDGACRTLIKMGGKETTWNGNWSYRDGILTISGAGGDGNQYSQDLKLHWYGNDEFEVRFANVGQYEKLLMQPENIKSATCRYEPSGVLHTQMIISAQGNESAIVSVQSPQIYERDGAPE